MDEKILRIISLLTEQTKSGKIKWTATSTANEYKVLMDGGTIVVNKFVNSAGMMAISFKLYNPKGIIAVNESR